MGNITQEINFEREKWNDAAFNDFAVVLSREVVCAYFERVDDGSLILFGFKSGGIRLGSGLYEINGDTLICLEVAGKNLPIENFLFGFSLGLAKNFKCDKFVLGTKRQGLKKIATARGFKETYCEFEIEVK